MSELFNREKVAKMIDDGKGPLKPGDSVLVYGWVSRMVPAQVIAVTARKAKIFALVGETGYLKVQFEDEDKDKQWEAHEKQCRRIKKKTELWIGPMDLEGGYAQVCVSRTPRLGWKRFVESAQ